ncbi:cation-transporting P-type ATPase [Methanobacterium sp.]|uniref:cation-transporting P-type ATPase n=1 Tax=Methanobacterium sp. TaxID=2164 RepID=UPI003C734E98
MNADEAKNSSLEELLKKLSSNKMGISSSQAQKRLQEYGPNEISEKKVNPILKFFKYFWGPMPWLIEVAIILSAVIQHWADLVILRK